MASCANDTSNDGIQTMAAEDLDRYFQDHKVFTYIRDVEGRVTNQTLDLSNPRHVIRVLGEHIKEESGGKEAVRLCSEVMRRHPDAVLQSPAFYHLMHTLVWQLATKEAENAHIVLQNVEAALQQLPGELLAERLHVLRGDSVLRLLLPLVNSSYIDNSMREAALACLWQLRHPTCRAEYAPDVSFWWETGVQAGFSVETLALIVQFAAYVFTDKRPRVQVHREDGMTVLLRTEIHAATTEIDESDRVRLLSAAHLLRSVLA